MGNKVIFDSQSMRSLRAQYRGIPDFASPRVVFLDRSDALEGERAYLEQLMQVAPVRKQNDWIGRLVNVDDEQHCGAWFELMLFGWLRSFGEVDVEPEIEGTFPDFGLNAHDQQIYIEARAILTPAEERQREKRIAEVLHILRRIPRSFLLTVVTCKFGGALDQADLFAQAYKWLDTSPGAVFIFQDDRGNRIGIQAERTGALPHADVMGPSSVQYANPDVLKAPLREKAGQHRALRRAGHAYVLAVFLERWLFSVEEVVEAWFGKHTLDIDIETKQIIEQRLDGSGLYAFRGEARHKTVSGTLVFRANHNALLKRHELDAWYVQNPVAADPIEPGIFPVKASFVALGQTAQGYSMGWRHLASGQGGP